MNYDTIEEAFLFVSGPPPFEHTAVVHRKTGESFYASLMSDYDELPEDVDESDDYINIPHKNDLDLGKSLVMEFVRSRCPEEIDRVLTIFCRRGGLRPFQESAGAEEPAGRVVRLRAAADTGGFAALVRGKRNRSGMTTAGSLAKHDAISDEVL
jgi:hypothetical protein